MPKPLPAGLRIRQLQPNDIPALAKLLASTPDDGSLYQFPNVLEYADDMAKMHVGWLSSSLRSKETLMRVAVIADPATGDDKLICFSSWGRATVDQETGKQHNLELRDESWSEADEAIISSLETQSKEDSTQRSKALEPNKAQQEAVNRARKRQSPYPLGDSGYVELSGLAVDSHYQGHGIGTLLMQWGIERATSDNVPLFTGGEERGVLFYERALGFQRVKGNEYWLDSEGNDISAVEVENGNEGWKTSRGGLSGASVVWVPRGLSIEVKGHVYSG